VAYSVGKLGRIEGLNLITFDSINRSECVAMLSLQHAGQAPRFYGFNRYDYVPANDLLRGIDQFLDLGEPHQYLAPLYSHAARPSIDPELRTAAPAGPVFYAS
jgi:hypothetical protein